MNFREYTCKSSPLIEELIPPVLYDGKKCIPYLKDSEPHRCDEDWITSLTFTRDDILRTIDFLKEKYKHKNYAEFLKISFGQHQEIQYNYMYYDAIYNYETTFKDSKKNLWSKPRNVRCPETNSKITSLVNSNIESELEHDKYDVAWHFMCDILEDGEYSRGCCSSKPYEYRICMKATLYIYDPKEKKLESTLPVYKHRKPKYK